MKFTRRDFLPLLTGAVIAPTLTWGGLATKSPHATDNTAAALTPEEARSIAQEVFMWGMHPVAIYHLRYIHAQNPKSPRFVGLNRLKWAREPTKALPRFATTPNATTLYGLAALDLSQEPIVLTVSRPDERYWSVQMAENYSRWWHMIGSQFNAPGPVRRLLIGPNWSGALPADFVGEEIVQSPSDFSVAVARVALTDDTAEELKSINAFMDRITLMPLSQWLAAGKKDVRAEDVVPGKADYPTYPGMEKVREPARLRGTEFLQWVSLILNDPSFTKQADGNKELQAFARFERLGLKAGLPFDPSRLSPALQAAVAEGIEDGIKAIKDQLAKGMGKPMNGWSLATDLGYHDTNWIRRALAGYIAVLGPVPVRSHTAARTFNDADGQPLNGQHRYTLTFNLDDLPPVTEFWELPLYDQEGFFVDNPINRYSLNSYMLQRGKLHTTDGKLVIYVQADEPANPDQRRNWLPAPKDTFQFTARFYGPHGPLIDGSYAMPGVVKVG
ncbi:DUF1254 domain-containing protein [Pseudomonas serbica]